MSRIISISIGTGVSTGVSTGSSVGTGAGGRRRRYRQNRRASSIIRGTPAFLGGWCMDSINSASFPCCFYVLNDIIMINEVHE